MATNNKFNLPDFIDVLDSRMYDHLSTNKKLLHELCNDEFGYGIFVYKLFQTLYRDELLQHGSYDPKFNSTISDRISIVENGKLVKNERKNLIEFNKFTSTLINGYENIYNDTIDKTANLGYLIRINDLPNLRYPTSPLQYFIVFISLEFMANIINRIDPKLLTMIELRNHIRDEYFKSGNSYRIRSIFKPTGDDEYDINLFQTMIAKDHKLVYKVSNLNKCTPETIHDSSQKLAFTTISKDIKTWGLVQTYMVLSKIDRDKYKDLNIYPMLPVVKNDMIYHSLTIKGKDTNNEEFEIEMDFANPVYKMMSFLSRLIDAVQNRSMSHIIENFPFFQLVNIPESHNNILEYIIQTELNSDFDESLSVIIDKTNKESSRLSKKYRKTKVRQFATDMYYRFNEIPHSDYVETTTEINVNFAMSEYKQFIQSQLDEYFAGANVFIQSITICEKSVEYNYNVQYDIDDIDSKIFTYSISIGINLLNPETIKEMQTKL